MRCRYPYVSHLVCNAGVAPFLKISWSLFCQQLWREILGFRLLRVVTEPAFYLQRVGLMSDDGLGWAWQCNVFGHYILVRPLRLCLRLLMGSDARRVWCLFYSFIFSAGRWRQSLQHRGQGLAVSCGCPRTRRAAVLTIQKIGRLCTTQNPTRQPNFRWT